MVPAARKMHTALHTVQKFRISKGIPILQEVDPNQTGLIGAEFTPITTTLGNLEAKQTSLNPDFAALLVLWFSQLELQPGDRVGMQFSGSFPALCIAAIIAAEELQIVPVISSSIGASSFGANLPELTYPDIEKFLLQEGIINHGSTFVTPGGNEDNGSSFWQGGDSIAMQAAERNGYSLTIPNSLRESIQHKLKFFRENGEIKAFVNIGGNQSAIGNCPHSPVLPVGLVRSHPACHDSLRGLLMYSFEEKIPVIHLLNIRSVAAENGIHLTPYPLPEPGKSRVYYKIRNSKPVIIGALILLFAAIFFSHPRLPQTFFRQNNIHQH
ncbi:MAG: poly-gamma-glutamate system protein [Calditrichia bacterium]